MKKKLFFIIPYCIPYLTIIYSIHFYYEAYLNTIIFTFILPSILYIMLGYMCGKRNLIDICIAGTLIQEIFVCLSAAHILPFLEKIYSGTLIAFAPFSFIFVIITQIIGYWGGKPSK